MYMAGKTYRIRVHNVGISTSLNFRIQNHNLLLVETEGHYTTQTNFTSFDIHAGQSYSFLLSTDQNASTDYYIVASARFVNESLREKVTGVAILHYSNSKGPATGPLPPPPSDFYDKTASMNQARSVRFVTLFYIIENFISNWCSMWLYALNFFSIGLSYIPHKGNIFILLYSIQSKLTACSSNGFKIDYGSHCQQASYISKFFHY